MTLTLEGLGWQLSERERERGGWGLGGGGGAVISGDRMWRGNTEEKAEFY